MDKLRLEIRAMDELHPDLKELAESMSRMTTLPSDFEGKEKVNSWYDAIRRVTCHCAHYPIFTGAKCFWTSDFLLILSVACVVVWGGGGSGVAEFSSAFGLRKYNFVFF